MEALPCSAPLCPALPHSAPLCPALLWLHKAQPHPSKPFVGLSVLTCRWAVSLMFHLADEDSRSATGNKTFGAVAAADSPDDAAFFLELVHKVSTAGAIRCCLAPL